MKMHGGAAVHRATSSLGEGEDSRSSRFTLEERAPCTHVYEVGWAQSQSE
jgi:hypothetical protein